MKTTDYAKGNRERRIVAGMILSSRVLGKIASIKNREWGNECARILDKLCVPYYEKHSQAPKRNIVALIDAWATTNQREETIDLVSRMVQHIFDEVERTGKINSGHCISEAVQQFNENRIRKALSEAQGFLDLGRIEDAAKSLDINRIDEGISTITEPFNDPKEVDYTFAEQAESLIEYTEGLKVFFANTLTAGQFIAFMGREGMGKSQWLLDLACRAALQRRRVVYLQVGDMTRRQVNRRFFAHAAEWPFFSEDLEWPCKIKWPTAMDNNGNIDHEIREFRGPLDEKTCKAAQIKFQKAIKSRECYFKLSCHSNNSITVYGVKDVLRELERDGFVPEVVVVDYADNLGPPNSRMESRDQINLTWSILRQISMDRDCLLVTATQGNRESYEAKTGKMKHISEEKRKLGHIDAMAFINQSDAEKDVGGYRLNWIKNRNTGFSPKRCCYVAGCLEVAHAAILSRFPKLKRREKKDEE